MRHHSALAPFHGLRAAMLAAAMVSLAACAHLLAGGRLPAMGILGAVIALTGLACTAATRLRLGFPAVTGLLGAGQLLLHEAFSALSVTATGPATGVSGHHHHLAFPPAGALDPVQQLSQDSGLAVLMLTGHVLATLGCALLLARGENALWGLAAWLRPLFRLPAPAAHDAAASASPSACWPDADTPRPWRNQAPDRRRGPPAAVDPP